MVINFSAVKRSIGFSPHSAKLPNVRVERREQRSEATLASVRFPTRGRSEEHTSELQSHHDLVCRLLLEKKKKNQKRLVATTKKDIAVITTQSRVDSTHMT